MSPNSLLNIKYWFSVFDRDNDRYDTSTKYIPFSGDFHDGDEVGQSTSIKNIGGLLMFGGHPYREGNYMSTSISGFYVWQKALNEDEAYLAYMCKCKWWSYFFIMITYPLTIFVKYRWFVRAIIYYVRVTSTVLCNIHYCIMYILDACITHTRTHDLKP